MFAFVQLLAMHLDSEGHELAPELLVELVMLDAPAVLADAPAGSVERLRELVTEAVHAALHLRATSQLPNTVH